MMVLVRWPLLVTTMLSAKQPIGATGQSVPPRAEWG